MRQLEDRVFIGFVIVATLAMAWVAAPFWGAILWALVASIMFAPVNERLVRRIPNRKTSAASATLLLIIAVVIIPAFMLGSLLIEQAISTYVSLQNRELDVGKLLADVQAGLPGWLAGPIERFDIRTLPAIEEKLSNFLTSAFRIAATQALSFGQSAFSFVMGLGIMLYLTFFLLRDGRDLTRTIGQRVPLRAEQRGALFEKFTTVIRATIKGSIVVAIVQGFLGGMAFWFLGVDAALLWGVIMGFMSLIPAIGTGIVWVPVAIYLLATGSIWQGVALVLFGFFVISMVDNVLRPILVGKDTRMPDYVVLISTLGGIGVMGINGFIVGPVIAAMFIAAWDIFAEWRQEGE